MVERSSSEPDNQEKAKVDLVNSPPHYRHGNSKFQAVDVIEHYGLNWHLGTAVKYLIRYNKKDPHRKKMDIDKAIWYLRRFLQSGQPFAFEPFACSVDVWTQRRLQEEFGIESLPAIAIRLIIANNARSAIPLLMEFCKVCLSSET